MFTRSVSGTLGLKHYWDKNGNTNTLVQLGTVDKQLNMYGLLAESELAADCYIQFFDVGDAADVTLGTTDPTFVFKVPAGGSFGRDMQNLPLRHFDKGCVFAVTTTRTGAVAPASPIFIHVWYWDIV